MSYLVSVLTEADRGCGSRKPGADGVGIYMMGGKLSAPCERLPMPLIVCPTCGEGIHYSRSFTWINPMKLFYKDAEPKCGSWMAQFVGPHEHDRCPMCLPAIVGPKAGLIWIGARFYTPIEFLNEAARRGVSRKLPAIPRGFTIGEDWIYLAHVDGVPVAMQEYQADEESAEKVNGKPAQKPKPGVISVFRPTHVDLVISPKKIDLHRVDREGDTDICEAKDEEQLPEKARRIVDQLGPERARIVIIEESQVEIDFTEEETADADAIE